MLKSEKGDICHLIWVTFVILQNPKKSDKIGVKAKRLRAAVDDKYMLHVSTNKGAFARRALDAAINLG